PCGLPRVRGEGEGAQRRPRRPAIETTWSDRRGPRVLHQCGETRRDESRWGRERRGRENRRRRGPSPDEADRPLSLRPPEFVPRRAGPRARTDRLPRKGPRRPRPRRPRLHIRLLQSLPSRGERPPALTPVPRDRPRFDPPERG